MVDPLTTLRWPRFCWNHLAPFSTFNVTSVPDPSLESWVPWAWGWARYGDRSWQGGLFVACLGVNALKPPPRFDHVSFACCQGQVAKDWVPYHIRVRSFFERWPGAMKAWKLGSRMIDWKLWFYPGRPWMNLLRQLLLLKLLIPRLLGLGVIEWVFEFCLPFVWQMEGDQIIGIFICWRMGMKLLILQLNKLRCARRNVRCALAAEWHSKCCTQSSALSHVWFKMYPLPSGCRGRKGK